jgi:hypothetical protein
MQPASESVEEDLSEGTPQEEKKTSTDDDADLDALFAGCGGFF